MKTYTYSEARRQFAAVLDEARRSGRVQIRRRDGQVFVLLPATQESAPLDVPGVDAGLADGEGLAWLKDGRDRSGERLLDAAAAGGPGIRRSRKTSTKAPRRTRR